MEVMAIQVVILASLCICRVFSPARLPILAAGWSVLTLVLVFMPWLMVLQLIVIWTTFSWLSPKQSNTEQDNNNRIDKSAERALLPTPLVATIKSSSFLQSIEKLNDDLARRTEIEKALGPIQNSLYAEKLWIDFASESAQRTIRAQDLIGDSPERAERYRRASAEFDESLKQARVAAGGKILVPEKIYPPNLADAQLKDYGHLTEEVRTRLEMIQKARRDTHRSILRTVYQNVRAIDPFWEELEKIQPFIFQELRKLAAEEGFSIGKPAIHNINGSAFFELPLLGSERAEIKARVKDLGIPYLLHFTRIENLNSILDNGICPPSILTQREIDCHVNDPLRYDGQKDASCFSLGHPNSRLFWRWRHEKPEKEWVVLMIDPAVLWTHDVAFCATNAAVRSISRTSLEYRRTVNALNSMYESVDGLPSRDSQMLRPYDPTDVQAEALVFGVVMPSMIIGARFESEAALEHFRTRMSGDLKTRGGAYRSREYIRRNGGEL